MDIRAIIKKITMIPFLGKAKKDSAKKPPVPLPPTPGKDK